MTPPNRINIIAMFLIFIIGGAGMYSFLNTEYGSEVDKSFQEMINKHFPRENKKDITTVTVRKADEGDRATMITDTAKEADKNKNIFLTTMVQTISDKNADKSKEIE
jgi:flagellar motor component MotA